MKYNNKKIIFLSSIIIVSVLIFSWITTSNSTSEKNEMISYNTLYDNKIENKEILKIVKDLEKCNKKIKNDDADREDVIKLVERKTKFDYVDDEFSTSINKMKFVSKEGISIVLYCIPFSTCSFYINCEFYCEYQFI
jgi:hypothetical protein